MVWTYHCELANDVARLPAIVVKTTLKTKLFVNYELFSCPSFPQKQIQMAADCHVFKFLQRSVDGKHLMGFQSETFVFKFLQRSVDGKHLMGFQSETFVFKIPSA